MLTQKMSKEALLVGLKVDLEDNLNRLRVSRALFARTLDGLKSGDEELGLQETKVPKIINRLNKVDWLWKPFNNSVLSILENGKVEEIDVSVIASTNVPLLTEMDKTVSLYEEDAIKSGVNPYVAIAINLSGRQRMLLQKMTKEFLLIASGYNIYENTLALEGTIALFDKRLYALIYGDISIGLTPAVDEKVKKQLLIADAMWQDFLNDIESEPTLKNSRVVAHKSAKLLEEIDKAVYLFEALEGDQSGKAAY